MKNILNYIFIFIGISCISFGKINTEKIPYLVIIGIAFTMYGLYRISSKLPSKKDDNDSDFVKYE